MAESHARPVFFRTGRHPLTARASQLRRLSQREALVYIVENADLLLVDGTSWLLLPAPAELVDCLAIVGERSADLEVDTDFEAEHGT